MLKKTLCFLLSICMICNISVSSSYAVVAGPEIAIDRKILNDAQQNNSNIFFKMISLVGTISWNISQVNSAYYGAKSLISLMTYMYCWAKNKIVNTVKNPDEVMEKFEKLCKDIKGQDEAIKVLSGFLYTILIDKQLCAFNNTQYSHGDGVLIYGPSGSGKSLVAGKLAEALGVEPYIMSASQITSCGESDEIRRIFKGSQYGGEGSYYGEEQKSVVKYLVENKGHGVIIFNEPDKLPEDVRAQLDEFWRAVIDQGIVEVDGQKLDFRGTIVIFTSNEVISGAEGSLSLEDQEDDGTNSRTKVSHDTSYLNRLKLVEFGNLTASAYKEIVKQEWEVSLINYWQKVHGVEVVISDEVFEEVALKTEKINRGSRYLEKLRADLNGKIIEKVREAKSTWSKTEKLIVDYDLDKNLFSLEQVEKEKDEKNCPSLTSVKSVNQLVSA